MLRFKSFFLVSIIVVLSCQRREDVLPIEMVGTWQSVKGASFEYWTSENSGMRGMSFSTTDSSYRPNLQEKLEIYKRDGGLVFIAEPLNQTRTEFEIVESSRFHFRAENPLHDFPKWISYSVNVTRDSMFAKIGDHAKAMDFVFIKSRD